MTSDTRKNNILRINVLSLQTLRAQKIESTVWSLNLGRQELALITLKVYCWLISCSYPVWNTHSLSQILLCRIYKKSCNLNHILICLEKYDFHQLKAGRLKCAYILWHDSFQKQDLNGYGWCFSVRATLPAGAVLSLSWEAPSPDYQPSGLPVYIMPTPTWSLLINNHGDYHGTFMNLEKMS